MTYIWTEVNEINYGVQIVDDIISIVTFVDDFVIFVENEEDLPTLLKFIEK